VSGQLDPVTFWNAWARGSQVRVDVFAEAWSLWDNAAASLDALRTRYGVPALDPAYAAGGAVPAWYRPVA
jgi:hypothetical protein